jgi:hypothetical protein
MRSWLLVALAACNPVRAAPPATPPAPQPLSYRLTDLVGDWRWLLRTSDHGTPRIENEQWKFLPIVGDPDHLTGRYVRSVEVRSDDRVPFACNQRPWYRQRAVFDVAVELTQRGFTIQETGYRAEPSPCDHGFRHVGAYTAALTGERVVLSWQGGSQTLWKIGDDATALPADPWPQTPALAGAWRWDATSYDDDNNIRDESEWWEITMRGPADATQFDATYRRRVTTRSADGTPIPCARAATWSFDDAYVLVGQREEEHWRLKEVAAEPGDHPCLRATPKRNLDEATAEQLGDYLLLEWRGKRREILYRPD